MNPIRKIGETRLLEFKIDVPWTKKDLCNSIMDQIGSSSTIRPAQYGYFYLKIFGGYYDNSIVPEEYCCCACPRNSQYDKFHDFNSLKDIKQQVLVLKSKFVDFREYEVYCAYYTDADEIPDAEHTKVELWADRLTFYKSILRSLGYRG